MSISYNYYFNQLFHNILEILQYGDQKQVTTINYQGLVIVVNQKLVYNTIQIQIDFDIQQMINRWKSIQILK